MSQKSSKKVSVTKDITQPSGTSTNGEKRRPMTALSPTRFTRTQEKNEMISLNNRLAVYIERVKCLEAENQQLAQDIYSSQEATAQEVSNVKALYESELGDLRKALEREAKQKTLLEMECKRNVLEVEELKGKLEKVAEELNKAIPYIAQFNELNSKNSQTLIDNENLLNQNKKLANELTIEKKNVKDAKKTMEEEILKRVTVENQLQSLKDSFKFKEEVHNQLLNDARTSRRTDIINEVDGRLTMEYENKLQNELQVLRQQSKEDVMRNKQDISDLFDSKVKNLENELKRKKKAVELAQENVSTANTRIQELTQQVNSLLASKDDYLTKITELERITENQRIKYQSDINELERQLTAMHDEMSQKVQEYQDLMDIKVALDVEISAYRKLLESEERRLSITPNTSIISSPRGKKRKLFQWNEPENEFSNVVTASSTGDIEISEVCPDGQFIKLYNKGSKEVALGGFELVHTTDKQNNPTVFKFQKKVVLEAGNFITVWSSTAINQILKPCAGSIVMNTQDWVVGDLMATLLLNTEGQEIATHELKKEHAGNSRANLDFDENELRQPGDLQTEDKCLIM